MVYGKRLEERIGADNLAEGGAGLVLAVSESPRCYEKESRRRSLAEWLREDPPDASGDWCTWMSAENTRRLWRTIIPY